MASTDVSLTYGATAGASTFVPELWSSAVKNYFEKPQTFMSLADTSLSGLVQQQGDTIHIPQMVAHTAQDTTPQDISALSSAITYHSNDDKERKLQINKLAYSAHIIADVVKIQATPEMFNMYVQGMGYAISDTVENYLGSLFTGAGVSNPVEVSLDTANEFDTADLKDLISGMYSAGANPRDGYVVVVSPELAGDMMQETAFTSADFTTNVAAVTPSGTNQVAAFGMLAGMPVYVSDTFTAATAANTIVGAVFKPDNLKLAYQVQPTVVDQYSVDYLGTKVAAYVAYGAILAVEEKVFVLTQP